jgi:hypothetical protein
VAVDQELLEILAHLVVPVAVGHKILVVELEHLDKEIMVLLALQVNLITTMVVAVEEKVL